MSKNVEERVKCLLCEEGESKNEKCNLIHIHGHLGYKKYACRSCKFTCHTEDEAMLHKYKVGHLVTHNNNEYKEALSNLIYLNCLHASEFGISAVVSDGVINTHSSLAKSELCNSTFDKNDGYKSKIDKDEISKDGFLKTRKKDRDITNSGIETSRDAKTSDASFDSSHDSSKRKKAKHDHLTPPADVLVNDKASSSSISSLVEKSKIFYTGCDEQKSSKSEEIAHSSVMPLKRNIFQRLNENEISRCCKCGKEVSSSYFYLKTHVMEVHAKYFEKDCKESEICTAIRSCFPASTVYSDEQCVSCGKFVKTNHGRKTHVITYHFHRNMECVVPGCGLFEAAPNDLKRHIEGVHGVPLSSSVNSETYRLYMVAKKEYEAALAAEIIKYFPFNLPNRNLCNFDELKNVHNMPSISSREKLLNVDKISVHDVAARSEIVAEKTSSTSPDSSLDSLENFFKDMSKKKLEIQKIAADESVNGTSTVNESAVVQEPKKDIAGEPVETTENLCSEKKVKVKEISKKTSEKESLNADVANNSAFQASPVKFRDEKHSKPSSASVFNQPLALKSDNQIHSPASAQKCSQFWPARRFKHSQCNRVPFEGEYKNRFREYNGTCNGDLKSTTCAGEFPNNVHNRALNIQRKTPLLSSSNCQKKEENWRVLGATRWQDKQKVKKKKPTKKERAIIKEYLKSRSLISSPSYKNVSPLFRNDHLLSKKDNSLMSNATSHFDRSFDFPSNQVKKEVTERVKEEFDNGSPISFKFCCDNKNSSLGNGGKRLLGATNRNVFVKVEASDVHMGNIAEVKNEPL
uniref:C2H2-type domain-containing protein n=1 Tax=Syphacia muris TaxID=451379 RepID=A0A0N5AUH9_9BILA